MIKYILLVLGILGIVAAIYQMILKKAVVDYWVPLFCGGVLIYAFVHLNNKDRNKNF